MTEGTTVRPPLSNPWIFLATAGGSGYLPKAPGTWGSIVAMLLAWPIAATGGVLALGLAALAVTLIGVRATAVYSAETGDHDPGPVVIDEVAGQWIALLACPLDPLWYLAGFALFRLFDIVKVPPARQVDQGMSGPWGVMLDDVVAGGYALAVLVLALWSLS